MSGRRAALIVGPLLAVLLYLPTLRHDFVFDDHAVIGLNPRIHDLDDLPRLVVAPWWNTPLREHTLYRPLTSATLAVDYALAGGMRPLWFHLVNVVLHGAATFLVAWLALALLPGTGGPLLAGTLFAVHPIHVEAVAGIVGRAEILAACGVLGTLLCQRAAARAAGRRAVVGTAGAWVACLSGMLAKESAIVAPVLCALDAWIFPAAAPRGRRRTLLFAGYGGAVLLYVALRVVALGSLGPGAPVPFVDNPAASAGPIAGRLTALGSVARYAVLLLWPARLSADYSFDQIPVIRTVVDPWALAGMAIVIAVTAGGVLLRRRAPAAAFALLWIALSAALTSNLPFFIGTLLAERLMYLPSVGLCLLTGAILASVQGRRVIRSVAAAAAIVVAGAATARSWARVPEWRDDFALYRSAARVSPRSARIRYNLGNAHLRLRGFDEAESHYRAALAIYPEFEDAKVNLGMTLLQQGRPTEALELLAGAAARSPRSALLAVNLGTAYRALGDLKRADQEFRRALALEPALSLAWNDLGSIHLARGDVAEAVTALTRAVEIDPGTAIYRVNLADALLAAGREEDALREFSAAARIDPAHPEVRRGLGETAFRRGDRAAAEREFRAAVAAGQPSARAANYLGFLLAERGEVAAAVEYYVLALRLDPTLHDAHRSLGLLYAQRLNDPVRAARHLEESLRLDPEQGGAEDLRNLLRHLRR